MNREQEKTIRELEETRNEIIRFSSELEEKLANKEIDRIEYGIQLHEKLCGKEKEEVIRYIESQIADIQRKTQEEEHKKQANKKLVTISAAAIVMIVMAMIGILMTDPGALTGYVIKSVEESSAFEMTFEQNTETTLELIGITGFKISGTLEGESATVRIRAGELEYLVAEIINIEQALELTRTYTLRTDKTSYSMGESAQIIITPESSNASIYVTYENDTQIIEGTTYTPAETGEYKVVAVISDPVDIVRLETGFSVAENITNETLQGDNTASQEITEMTNQTEEAYAFESVCEESCSINETDNPVLVVELAEGATLRITEITITQNRENQAPIQTETLPDIRMAPGEERTINLDGYFTDPDDRIIYYDVSAAAEVTATIEEENLRLSSSTIGEHQVYVYASDESELTASNIFLLTITEEPETMSDNSSEENATEEITEGVNETLEETGEEGNETIENTAGGMNETDETNETTDTETTAEPEDPCTNPDINQRPSSCFVGLEEEAFINTPAVLQDKNRGTVGTFTRFGNLVIRGLLVQGSASTPETNDFQLGYYENQGFSEEWIPAAWISTEDGNLHLKGSIYENQEILEPSQFGTFIIRNRFGLILGYFDEQRGDLYLRGNIVQLGRI